MAEREVVIGCIGSRDLPDAAAAACREIAAELARGGFHVATGATPGQPGRDLWAGWADAAFAYGAAQVAPETLLVCLPWRHFPRGSREPEPGVTVGYAEDHPEWAEAAAAFWAACEPEEGDWRDAVPRARRLLQARSVGVVLSAQMVLAWPHGEADEADETQFALRFAEWRGVPALDLTQTAWWTVARGLVERLAAARPGGQHAESHDAPGHAQQQTS